MWQKMGAEHRSRMPLAWIRGSGETTTRTGRVNPDVADNRGRTPLSYTTWGAYEGVVKLLLEREEVNPSMEIMAAHHSRM